MLKETKEFNQKYNLTTKDLMLFNQASLDQFMISQVMGKPSTRGIDIAKRFFKNVWTIIALFILLIIICLTIFAPIFSPYNGTEPISKAITEYKANLPSSLNQLHTLIRDQDFLEDLQQIEESSGLKIVYNKKYLETSNLYEIYYDPYVLLQALAKEQNRLLSIIGTDGYGRDIWTRVWIGTRNALALSFFILVIQTIVGVTLGSYLGFHAGHRVDTLAMRIIEIFNTIPVILWVIILIGIFGTSFTSIFFTLTFINIFGPISSTRMFMISIKDSEFLVASKALGSSKFRVIYIEALPLIIGKLASNFVSQLMNGVFSLSALAFLGFINDGLSESPNLGLSLYSSRLLASTNPWAVAFPVIILLSAIASLKVVAIGLHDALDVKATKV